IANRAAEMLGAARGDKSVHPNDHVNLGQSSNDLFPTAIHIAALEGIELRLVPALEALRDALAEKAEAFRHIVKVGRTHLQDATPTPWGTNLRGTPGKTPRNLARLKQAEPFLAELPLGGTAVGTGINTHPEFARRTIQRLAEETHLSLTEASNHFEAHA